MTSAQLVSATPSLPKSTTQAMAAAMATTPSTGMGTGQRKSETPLMSIASRAPKGGLTAAATAGSSAMSMAMLVSIIVMLKNAEVLIHQQSAAAMTRPRMTLRLGETRSRMPRFFGA